MTVLVYGRGCAWGMIRGGYGRGFAPDAPLTVGDVRTTASQFLFYGE